MVNLLPPLCIPILLCHHHQTFMFLHFSMQSYRLERSSSCQPLCHLSRKSSRSLSRCTQCIFLTRTCMFAHVASLFIVILTIIVLWALVCSTTDTKNLWGMGFAKKMSFHGQLHLSLTELQSAPPNCRLWCPQASQTLKFFCRILHFLQLSVPITHDHCPLHQHQSSKASEPCLLISLQRPVVEQYKS